MKKLLLVLAIITTPFTAQAEVSKVCEQQIMVAMFVVQYEDVCAGSFHISRTAGSVAGQVCKINGDNNEDVKKSLSIYERKFKEVPSEQFCNQGTKLYNETAIEFRKY